MEYGGLKHVFCYLYFINFVLYCLVFFGVVCYCIGFGGFFILNSLKYL